MLHGYNGISNHLQHDCWFNRLLRFTRKTISKLCKLQDSFHGGSVIWKNFPGHYTIMSYEMKGKMILLFFPGTNEVRGVSISPAIYVANRWRISFIWSWNQRFLVKTLIKLKLHTVLAMIDPPDVDSQRPLPPNKLSPSTWTAWNYMTLKGLPYGLVSARKTQLHC